MDIEKVNTVLTKAIIGLQDGEIEDMAEAMAVGVTSYDVRPPPGFEKIQKVKEPPKPKKPRTEEEAWEEHEQARQYLNKNATKGKKKSQWWVPPHNLMINEALMGFNLWKFGYRIDVRHEGDRRDQGAVNAITLKPSWYPADSGRGIGAMTSNGFFLIDREIAKKMIDLAKKQGDISQDVAKQLDAAEAKFKMKIPSAIKSKVVKEAVKVAKRRMGAKGSAPEMLYPFDGSKPRKLRMWEGKEDPKVTASLNELKQVLVSILRAA